MLKLSTTKRESRSLVISYKKLLMWMKMNVDMSHFKLNSAAHKVFWHCVYVINGIFAQWGCHAVFDVNNQISINYKKKTITANSSN